MTIKKKAKHLLEVLVSVLKEKNDIPVIIHKDSESIMADKVAMIIGGTGGIGYAIAKKYAECGCKIIIAGTNEKKLDECSVSISGARTIYLDLMDISKIRNVILKASEFFGPINIFVCSSGVHTNRNGFAWNNVTEKDYDYVMDINLKGNYFLLQNIANYMVDSNIKGHILVVSSQSALEPAWSPYRLSKLGISGLIEGYAQQLIQYGVIVNGIGPGPTYTSMQKLGINGSIYTPDSPIERMAMPEEIAEFAKQLVVGAGDLVVGQTVYLSAGRGIIEKR